MPIGEDLHSNRTLLRVALGVCSVLLLFLGVHLAHSSNRLRPPLMPPLTLPTIPKISIPRKMTSVDKFIHDEWDKTIIPALCEYIKIPSQSPHYDPDWATNGLQEKAMDVIVDWLKEQPVKGMKYEVHTEPGRTPFLFLEIDGTTATEHTVLLYGHMDKQPPLLPWSEGLDPYTPVIRDGKLYGRAGADDGYSLFAAVAAIVALQKHNIPHSRCVITIEACEESGSADLPFYINKLKGPIGKVDLIVCLDSGALNYDQLWLTASLRGVASGVLKVRMLKDGMHSGIAGGVVPDTFRIARHLLNRIEDPATGEFLVKDAFCEVPASTKRQMGALNDVEGFKTQWATHKGASIHDGDNVALALRNFWEPCLTVVGDNLPPVAIAGNVIRAQTELKLSIRCPPLTKSADVAKKVKEILEKDAPYGAEVTFEIESCGDGWAAPELKPWLEETLNKASTRAYGKPMGVTGLGGSIPFMGMLGELYPEAQFVVTGVLGPGSNAHGPDEFLHINFGKGINCVIADVLEAHYKTQ